MRHTRAAMLALAFSALGTGALVAMMGRRNPSPDLSNASPPRNPPLAHALWLPNSLLAHRQQVDTTHHNITTPPPWPPRTRANAPGTLLLISPTGQAAATSAPHRW